MKAKQAPRRITDKDRQDRMENPLHRKHVGAMFEGKVIAALVRTAGSLQNRSHILKSPRSLVAIPVLIQDAGRQGGIAAKQEWLDLGPDDDEERIECEIYSLITQQF